MILAQSGGRETVYTSRISANPQVCEFEVMASEGDHHGT